MRVLATITLLAALATAAVVVLLNAADAAPGIAVAAVAILALAVGLAIGRTAERLPDLGHLGRRRGTGMRARAGEARH